MLTGFCRSKLKGTGELGGGCCCLALTVRNASIGFGKFTGSGCFLNAPSETAAGELAKLHENNLGTSFSLQEQVRQKNVRIHAACMSTEQREVVCIACLRVLVPDSPSPCSRSMLLPLWDPHSLNARLVSLLPKYWHLFGVVLW